MPIYSCCFLLLFIWNKLWQRNRKVVNYDDEKQIVNQTRRNLYGSVLKKIKPKTIILQYLVWAQ